MTIDLDALEALEKKATPGPWIAGGNGACGYGWLKNDILRGQYAKQPADYALVANARNALPELIRLARIGQRVERDAKETKCST